MAEDSFGESASIMVTIMVTPVDEAPVISVGGLAVTGQSAIDYAENGTGMVATYSAAGPDAARARVTVRLWESHRGLLERVGKLGPA